MAKNVEYRMADEVEEKPPAPKIISLARDGGDIDIDIDGVTVAYFRPDGDLVIWEDRVKSVGLTLRVEQF